MTAPFRLSPDGIYRCDAFQTFLWQEHGFGTRNGNPAVDITLRQVHSDRVIQASALRDREEEGDALITNDVRKSIGIRTADCVPILLLDSHTRAVAAVHAGWRGTASEIVKRTMVGMADAFGSVPANIYAALGPCIRECCYEVGEEVARNFSALFPEWSAKNKAVTHLDLPEANKRQLQAIGVPGDQIFDSCLCTFCQAAQFFSYRREPGNPGRMISVVTRLA